jgi:hypothetical protein
MELGLGTTFGGLGGMNPPYIRFETRAVARQKLVEEGGALFYEDVDFALITSHGSKDTVEKVVGEYFVYLKDQVRQGRYPQQWLDAYHASYRAWKNDQEMPVLGTPIKNWPAASPAEMKALSNLGIRAVEDLATANEELMGKLGMGGRSLKDRAKDWVTSSAAQAPLVAQMDAMRHVNEGLQRTIEGLKQQIGQLEARLGQQPAPVPAQWMPPVEDRLAAAQQQLAKGPSDDDVLKDVLAEIGE